MEKKYKTILVDPPWNITFIKLKMRPNQVKMPYPTMTLEELVYLGGKLQPYMDDKCNLFLWTTHTKLPEALKLMEFWGFKYHCLLTWDKTNGRPCWGFKRKTEFILYGFKGGITVNQRGTFIPTLFTEKLTSHSTKPQIFYQILEHNSPAPRLELFARQKREGWDCWGNEVESDIKLG
jgi:N6-adenosine-specific RNA methylase IME4